MSTYQSDHSQNLNEHPLGSKFSTLSDELMKLGNACRILKRATTIPTSNRVQLLQIINDHSEAHTLSRRVMDLLRVFQSPDARKLNKSEKINLFHLSQKYQDQLKILNEVSKLIESAQKEWILTQLTTANSVEMQDFSDTAKPKEQSPEILAKMKLKALAAVEQSAPSSGYSLDPGSAASNRYVGLSSLAAVPKYTVEESNQMLEESVIKVNFTSSFDFYRIDFFEGRLGIGPSQEAKSSS